jgi:hypothetical protein
MHIRYFRKRRKLVACKAVFAQSKRRCYLQAAMKNIETVADDNGRTVVELVIKPSSRLFP